MEFSNLISQCDYELAILADHVGLHAVDNTDDLGRMVDPLFFRLNRDAPQLTSASSRSVALNLATLREQMPAKFSQLCASSELMQKVWLKVYREVSFFNFNQALS